MPATRKGRRGGQGRVRTHPKKLSAKSRLVRETGLAPLPQMPWGTHLCIFYKTKDDLLDTCVSWFEAGVAGKECCVWAISDLVSEAEVLQVLRQRIPNFEALRQSGLFKILDGKDFYFLDGKIDAEGIFSQWQERLDWGLGQGYSGLRGAGITFWSGTHNWNSFYDYEAFIDKSLEKKKMLLLCLYPILTSSAQEVIEVARVHHSTIIRSEGEWDFLESAEAKLAKREIGRLQQALTLLSKPFPGYEKLTRREYMVLAQTVRGASSKEAARVLGIS